jgi:hypothetical protein
MFGGVFEFLSIFVIVNMYTIAKMPCLFINKNLLFHENVRRVQIYLHILGFTITLA